MYFVNRNDALPCIPAPEVSHNKRATSVGETIPVSRITAARCPSRFSSFGSLPAFRFLFKLPPRFSVADHMPPTFQPAHASALRASIRSVRLICVRNNLTPELRVCPPVSPRHLWRFLRARQINRHDDRYRDDSLSRVRYGIPDIADYHSRSAHIINNSSRQRYNFHRSPAIFAYLFGR